MLVIGSITEEISMKTLFWIVGLFVGCLGCSKPLNVLTGSPSDTYDATAILDNNPWYGSAFAQREYTIADKPCTENQFALGLSTDLPHAQSSNEPVGRVTGCKGTCIPTQRIGFHRVPLAVGKYKLSDIKSCVEGDTQTSSKYTLLVGGDIIIGEYYPLGVTIQQGQKSVSIPGTDASWIEVTSYDPTTNRVEGIFELTLKNTINEDVHFTKGTFKVTLTR